MMGKNTKFILAVLVLSIAVLPNLALAADCSISVIPCPEGKICFPNPLKYNSVECLIDGIIDFLFIVSLALVPLMVLIGAFNLMTAAGNENKVRTAKNIFIYTAVGFLIILMAKGLISAILALYGAP